MKLKKSILWILLSLFSMAEIYYTWIYKNNIPSSIHSIAILSGNIFLIFTAYTLYCSSRENLLKSIGRISQMHWGRQIGIDLYIGLFFQTYLIYLNETSILTTAVWFIPLMVYGNIITLLYWLLNAGSILGKFAY